jgi:hypothetical protein
MRKGDEVSPRFAYFYLMRDEPDRVRATVPKHVSHWRSLGLTGYVGGPFADRTGGLIMFEIGRLGDTQHAWTRIPSSRRDCWTHIGSTNGCLNEHQAVSRISHRWIS